MFTEGREGTYGFGVLGFELPNKISLGSNLIREPRCTIVSGGLDALIDFPCLNNEIKLESIFDNIWIHAFARVVPLLSGAADVFEAEPSGISIRIKLLPSNGRSQMKNALR